MASIIVERLDQVPVEARRVEVVERKGKGHPDSLCDAMLERVSVALCREYQSAFGRILHHNIDKGLLVAGASEPRLGGGRILEPMRLIVGDRASAALGARRIDVAGITREAVGRWLAENLRFVELDTHLVLQNELREGSPELRDLYERDGGANDTSVGVGYAPLSETERLVLGAERLLNSAAFKREFPETGEDVKVMGRRLDRDLGLTVAVAFVDRLVPDAKTYLTRKAEVQAALEHWLEGQLRDLRHVEVEVNLLDDERRGEDGLYLTVTGLSAESADSGQVGRGNRVNGLITPGRPMSIEAAAGKNPVRHVGKVYSLLANDVAAAVHAEVPGVREAYVTLCSQIGAPLAAPWVAAVQLVLESGYALSSVQAGAEAVAARRLTEVDGFVARLIRGEMPIC